MSASGLTIKIGKDKVCRRKQEKRGGSLHQLIINMLGVHAMSKSDEGRQDREIRR